MKSYATANPVKDQGEYSKRHNRDLYTYVEK